MKSQDTPFVGGPLDGRVLPVLLGPTGHPPRTYRIPVPDPAGGPPTVLVYRRAEAGRGGALGLHQGWRYEFDPEGAAGRRPRLRWPRPRRRPGATPGGAPEAADE